MLLLPPTLPLAPSGWLCPSLRWKHWERLTGPWFNTFPVSTTFKAFTSKIRNPRAFHHRKFPPVSTKFALFPTRNHEKPMKTKSVKMAKTSIVTHKTRAQTHENRAFSRGKLSGNRYLSHLTVTTLHYINIYILLSFSELQTLLTYITLQFQLWQLFSRHPHISNFPDSHHATI